MPYFNNDPQPQEEEDYQPVFQQPVEQDFDDEYYDEDTGEFFAADYDGEYLDEEERFEERQNRWRLMAGIGDFLGVLAGTVVILLLVALLISLITWVQSDISQTFTLWQTKI